jgi:hypothetical protein
MVSQDSPLPELAIAAAATTTTTVKAAISNEASDQEEEDMHIPDICLDSDSE